MRGYDDPCGIARALGLVGERWALLVVRELVFGPKRFIDLRHGLPGISDNVLSQRLRELAQADIVRRRKLGPPSSTWGYELTDRGRELEPVLTALGQWGSRIPISESANRELSVDALIFALRTTFDADLAGRLQATVQLRVDGDRFRAEVRSGHFRVARGDAGPADVAITAASATLRSLVFEGLPLAEAEQAGKAAISGNRHAAEHLLRCFPPSVQARTFAGVVLAGGRARRLSGVDKPMLEVGGEPLLLRAVAALAGAREIVVVGPERPGVPGVGWTVEEPPGGGPVAALAAGLDALQQSSELVAVLAADLPSVQASTVDKLRAALGPRADGAVLVDGDGRRQWLVGVWRTAALRAALPADPAGVSLRSTLGGLRLADVPAEPEESADVDTPADLDRARGQGR